MTKIVLGKKSEKFRWFEIQKGKYTIIPSKYWKDLSLLSRECGKIVATFPMTSIGYGTKKPISIERVIEILERNKDIRKRQHDETNEALKILRVISDGK